MNQNEIKNQEFKSVALTNTMWKFLERLFAQGISFVISIILARILVPEDYGVVSIVSIFFAFANVLISGGLNTALIQKKKADSLDYSTILYVSLLISIVLYFILFFLSPSIANIYGQPLLTKIIRVMALVLPINAVKSIYCAYISSSLQFKKFFFATLSGTIVSGIIGIILAKKGFGAWALVFQQLVNAFIDTLILIFVAKLRIIFKFSFKRLSLLWKYGWKVFLSSTINTAYHQSRPLFIGIRFSSIDLSYYTKGSGIPTLIEDTTTNTLSAVFFSVMSKKQDDKEALLNWTRRFIRTTSFLAFPCMLGLFAVSDNFILVLLTEKWIEASFYLKIFAISGMFSMIAIGNCETIKAMGKSDVYLKMEIIKKISYFIIIGVFMIFSKDPRGLAISTLLTTLVQIVVNSIPNQKLINYKIKYQIHDILINLIPSIIMCIIVYFAGYIPIQQKIILLIVQVVLGIAIYFSIAIITKNDSLLFIYKTLKDILKKSSKNDTPKTNN